MESLVAQVFAFPPPLRSAGPQKSVCPSRVGFICLKWLSTVQASISELVTWAAFTISGELSGEFGESMALDEVVTHVGQNCCHS